MPNIISVKAINRRKYWISEIKKLSGNFIGDAERLVNELERELDNDGYNALIDHLRLCGSIPEGYEHDSREEKLYSKYTDNLLALSFQKLGLKSFVLSERADSADVEAVSKKFSFVADAKVFRLSRTAKNQKDFKVQAMDGWKRGKSYAMIVCPIYQLPSKFSQIYQQATTRNVCIFTYSHLSVLVVYAQKKGGSRALKLLGKIFEIISVLNPSKNAFDYWAAVNRTMLDYDEIIHTLWRNEKKAALESISVAKEEGLRFLAGERERIMKMDHNQAIAELIKINKLESKIKIINSIADNGILEIK